MPRFSQAFLQQAASPGLFGAGVAGLGDALTQRRKQQERMLTGQQNMTFVNQAIAAAEQGDMNALNMQRQNLMELLSQTKDESARSSIINSINQINAARPATQATATTNKAQSIIKTEQALRDFDNQVGPLTEGEERAKSALQERLAVMKQDAQAVSEADSIQYQALYAEIQKKNQLAEQQATANRRTLSSVQFESKQYKELSKKLRDNGFGDTVDKYEQDQYDLMEARERADQIRKDKAPLTAVQKETLQAYGFKPNQLEIPQAKNILAKIEEREVEDRIRIANAPNARVANQAIRDHVETTLRTIQKQNDLPWNLFDDLYNKIEDLSEEDIQRLAGKLQRPAGEELTEAQIQQEVIDFVKTEFPNQWKDATQYQINIAEEAELVEVLTADLLVEKGLASRDENGVVDLSGVSEENIRGARREVERRRSIVPTFEEYGEGYVRSGMGSK